VQAKTVIQAGAAQFVPVAASATRAPSESQAAEPPDQPLLLAPRHASKGVATDPLLQVRIADPDLDGLDVTFFGREFNAPPAGDFTIVALPDTQIYSASHPDLFAAQTQWIVENRDALNIVYVAHEGDLVHEAREEEQWENADAALSLLEDPITTGLADGIPFSVVPGNHDEPSDYYDRFFGPSRFQGRNYYGGGYREGSNKNNYTLFSGGGMNFIAIGLEYESVASGVLAWADGLLQTHSDRRAIVVSHHILEKDGSFGAWGQMVYNTLKDNPNLFLMLSGHRHREARRVEVFEGNTVNALMANYQTYENGGDGFLRRLEFLPARDEIRVSTYSPVLDQYETDENSQFVLKYEMNRVQPFSELGAVGGVDSGEIASIRWPDLLPGTPYEWYVEVSDGSSITTSTHWTFTTSGTAPPCYNLDIAANPVDSGSVDARPSPNCGGDKYRQGSVVQISARPNTGFTFANWSGDLKGTKNPTPLAMDGDTIVSATFAEADLSDSVEIQIAASIDDMEEEVGAPAAQEKGVDLELGEDAAPQIVGLRFLKVQVPPGAAITLANLTFSADEVHTGAADLVILGQASDDAAPFDDQGSYLSNLPRTSAHVAWNDVPAWTTIQESYESPDLATVVQEIVSRPGWRAGNALALIITGTGKRVAVAFDGDPELAPKLRVEYGSKPATCYRLTAVAQPASGGSLVADPLPNCLDGTSYLAGTEVQLTAKAAGGNAFAAWKGDLSGDRNPTTLSMDSDREVTARFRGKYELPNPFYLPLALRGIH
jgi:hypothetical protein